jgi:beta-phosphoglucomutase-like phosphatase (HAD superfamily)
LQRNISEKETAMPAHAFIFDLSALPANPEAIQLLGEAVEHGLPCALISELPYLQAAQQLRNCFGDPAHHIFSVVLTGADFAAQGHKAPYSVVLTQLGVPPDEARAVAVSPRAIAAARSARIGLPATQGEARRSPRRKGLPDVCH